MTKPIALIVGDCFDRTAQEVDLNSLRLGRLIRVLVATARGQLLAVGKLKWARPRSTPVQAVFDLCGVSAPPQHAHGQVAGRSPRRKAIQRAG
jgi:hypothetical protein